ncbi:MAG TPA: DUF427 domain-containing protein [Thermoleophilaceae bacterium]|nr:DUF427 domain-containing protein [Thermoleophilaceae bacterium]
MESVWDYPRPPRLEPCLRRARIELRGQTVADSSAALRVLETSHPPGIYLPQGDFAPGLLVPVRSGRTSVCEWKGVARYFDVGGERDAAWTYPDPLPGFAALRAHVSVYPGRMDACYLDDERVQPQAGSFYGGWITAEVAGPFKGGPGTSGG